MALRIFRAEGNALRLSSLTTAGLPEHTRSPMDANMKYIFEMNLEKQLLSSCNPDSSPLAWAVIMPDLLMYSKNTFSEKRLQKSYFPSKWTMKWFFCQCTSTKEVVKTSSNFALLHLTIGQVSCLRLPLWLLSDQQLPNIVKNCFHAHRLALLLHTPFLQGQKRGKLRFYRFTLISLSQCWFLFV